jgi:hypothetical protein
MVLDKVSQAGNLPGFFISFRKLLESSSTDLELLADQCCVHIVFNNTLTDSGTIVLVTLHFSRSIGGQILSTKSLAYTPKHIRHKSLYTWNH